MSMVNSYWLLIVGFVRLSVFSGSITRLWVVPLSSRTGSKTAPDQLTRQMQERPCALNLPEPAIPERTPNPTKARRCSPSNSPQIIPHPQGPLPVLQGVDLRLARGSSLALMGESGSGKSTLLHLIAGLDRADSGRILIDDVALDSRSEASLAQWRWEGIGLVFQQYNLISSLDVAANLAFQARLADRHDPQWVAYLAERLGLAGLLARYPEQLSGGQQQRVAIGRALAGRPAWLLADEPTGSLDEASSDEVLSLLLQLVSEAGSGVLMVTHSPRLAARLQQRCQLQAGRVQPERGDEAFVAGPVGVAQPLAAPSCAVFQHLHRVVAGHGAVDGRAGTE
ncbi:Vitamin B12 import ATP-binding protein BtuD [Pseudomonas sp. MM223]|nr:Vitamin B12 import ATP-binding protein BtuD [Pseudomonas sp. MM223]